VPRAYLTVTIDTECDKGKGWRVEKPLAFRGVTCGVHERLEPLFASYGAKGTYLVSGEVLDDPASVDILRRTNADLGTHLHGETVPPDAFVPDVTEAFQRDYSEAIERAKLTNLTRSFRAAFGRAPTSFRAGRFGVGQASLSILASLGYEVESSVTPHMDWSGVGAKGLTFMDAPTQPYHPDWHSPGIRGDCPLWEVPVTIRKGWKNRVPFLRSRVDPRWLRPTRASGAALVALAREEILEASRGRSPPVLTCMFHNVEIVEGKSPYSATPAEAHRILGALAELLAFARREDVAVIGLSDVPAVLGP